MQEKVGRTCGKHDSTLQAPSFSQLATMECGLCLTKSSHFSRKPRNLDFLNANLGLNVKITEGILTLFLVSSGLYKGLISQFGLSTTANHVHK